MYVDASLTEMIYVLELAVLPITAIALSIIFTDNHCVLRGDAETIERIILLPHKRRFLSNTAPLLYLSRSLFI